MALRSRVLAAVAAAEHYFRLVWTVDHGYGLERRYRAQARLAPDRRRRIELVEAANTVRPRTWV